MKNNTTIKHHHYGTEAQFSSSPGEGRGHKPTGIPGRQGKSHTGTNVPDKPFEGELKAVSSPKVEESIMDSIVRKLKPLPKFPVNIVADKDGSCRVRRIYTNKDHEPEMEGLKNIKCTAQGVDILIPDEKKNMIPILTWAIASQRFWFSVIFKVAGMPLPKDRMDALMEKGKETVISPLSILEERKSQPEFLPCTELELTAVKHYLMQFWPGSAAAYPEQPQVMLNTYEMTVLQSAVKSDVFLLLLQNPILWLPIKHDQMDSLVLEFSTPGSILHSLFARSEKGSHVHGNDKEIGEMEDLSKDALIEVQLAERERSMTDSSDDCSFEVGIVVETEVPACGIASGSHDEDLTHENQMKESDRKRQVPVVETEVPAGGIASGSHEEELTHENQMKNSDRKRQVIEVGISAVVQDDEQNEQQHRSRANHTTPSEKVNLDFCLLKRKKPKPVNVTALRFYQAEAAELADDEMSASSTPKRVVLRRTREPKVDKYFARHKKSDSDNHRKMPPGMENCRQKGKRSKTEKSPGNEHPSKKRRSPKRDGLPGEEELPKKQGTLKKKVSLEKHRLSRKRKWSGVESHSKRRKLTERHSRPKKRSLSRKSFSKSTCASADGKSTDEPESLSDFIYNHLNWLYSKRVGSKKTDHFEDVYVRTCSKKQSDAAVTAKNAPKYVQSGAQGPPKKPKLSKKHSPTTYPAPDAKYVDETESQSRFYYNHLQRDSRERDEAEARAQARVAEVFARASGKENAGTASIDEKKNLISVHTGTEGLPKEEKSPKRASLQKKENQSRIVFSKSTARSPPYAKFTDEADSQSSFLCNQEPRDRIKMDEAEAKARNRVKEVYARVSGKKDIGTPLADKKKAIKVVPDVSRDPVVKGGRGLTSSRRSTNSELHKCERRDEHRSSMLGPSLPTPLAKRNETDIHKNAQASVDRFFAERNLKRSRDPTGSSKPFVEDKPRRTVKAVACDAQKRNCQKEQSLNKILEDELTSRNAAVHVFQKAQLRNPPKSQKLQEALFRDFALRMDQLTNYYDMLRKDLDTAYCEQNKEKKVHSAQTLKEYQRVAF